MAYLPGMRRMSRLPHLCFPCLPAVMHQHLQGVPEIVPEHVECRAHRDERIGEMQREEHGERGVLLPEGLAGFPAVAFFPHETASRKIERADQCAQESGFKQHQRGEFRIVMKKEGGRCRDDEESHDPEEKREVRKPGRPLLRLLERRMTASD